MNKIDCANIYNFINEWDRRKQKEKITMVSALEWFGNISSFTNDTISERLDDEIKKLQKWSDEHPKMTRKEKFKKMCEENGFENLNLNLCSHKNVPIANCKANNCTACGDYWNEEVDE